MFMKWLTITVDKLPINLTSGTVNDGYRKLVVAKAAVTNVLCKRPTMLNRFGISHELKTHSISQGNASFMSKKNVCITTLVSGGRPRRSSWDAVGG
jgi:hypothetical protein